MDRTRANLTLVAFLLLVLALNSSGSISVSTVGGMRVMILEESSPSKPLTDEQALALKSLAVREYLDTKTLADSQGGKGWRKYDPNVSLVNMPKEWQDMREKLKPDSLPWVGVANGSGRLVFQGPYPATQDSALAFFKKYGG